MFQNRSHCHISDVSEVGFTKPSDFFLFLCISYICSYTSPLWFLVEVTSWVCEFEMRCCSPQIPHKEEHWRPLPPSTVQCLHREEGYKRRRKKPTWILIYLSSSGFYQDCTRLYLQTLLRDRGESCAAGVTPSRWLLGCQGCCWKSWLR